MREETNSGVNSAAPATVILIHGVGPFDEHQIVADVRTLLASIDVFPKNIQAVNWRRIAGDLSGEEAQFLEQIAAISRGVQGAVHLEGPSPSLTLRCVRNLGLILPLVLSCLLLLPVRGVLWSAAALTIIGVMVLQILLSATLGGRTLTAAFVSSALPGLWTVAHACVVLPYLIVRLVVGTMGRLVMLGIIFVLIPLSFFIFPIGCLITFLPPIVLYLASHGFHQTVFSRLVPWWRRFVERSGAALLLLAADVIRYLGDNDYRLRVQEELSQAMRRLGGQAPVALVAHSLGSVIALDTLWKMRPKYTNNVTLITMGSPLLRLMHRLLPKEYPAPSRLRARLLETGLIRRWINIYRPLDMIGADLFQGSPGDYSTGERIKGWLPPLHAHMNYWNDRKVLDRIQLGWVGEGGEERGQSVERESIANGQAPADSAWFQIGINLPLFLAAAVIYARVVMWLAPTSFGAEGCVVVLGLLLFSLVAIPLIILVAVPFGLSLTGVKGGGADWVPAIEKSRKDYETSLLDPLGEATPPSNPKRVSRSSSEGSE